MLVADGSYRRQVQVFAATGELLEVWPPAPSVDISMRFAGIGVAGNGDVWIVGSSQKTPPLQHLSKNGTLVGGFGRAEYRTTPGAPGHIAVDGARRVYLADSTADRVLVFSRTGRPLRELHRLDSIDGPLRSPRGLDIDPHGRLFVADSGNSRVVVFDSSDKVLQEWSPQSTDPQAIVRPTDVAVGPDGRSYTLLGSLGEIECRDLAGHVVARWSGADARVGPLSSPSGIAVDAVGDVYVLDDRNHRVVVYSDDLRIDAEWPLPPLCPSFTSGIAVDAQRRVLLCGWGRPDLIRCDRRGGDPQYVKASPQAEIRLEGFADVAVAPDGSLFASLTQPSAVFDFGRQSTWRVRPKSLGAFCRPTGVATDSAGVVYVADVAGRVQALDSTGEFLQVWRPRSSRAKSRFRPADVAVAPNGMVLAIDAYYGRVWTCGPRGQADPWFGQRGGSQTELAGPTGIAVDAQGVVWIADSLNGRVAALAEDGRYLGQIQPSQRGSDAQPRPTAVAVDSQGFIYVLDAEAKCVEVWG